MHSNIQTGQRLRVNSFEKSFEVTDASCTKRAKIYISKSVLTMEHDLAEFKVQVEDSDVAVNLKKCPKKAAYDKVKKK